MKWTEQVWNESLDIYNKIIEQPFIKELADGSLSEERFSRYIAQDEIYVGNYGRQMYELANQMSNAADREFFIGFADAGIASEKAMHELLIERMGIDTKVESSAITTAYNSHTQRCIDMKIPEVGIAAMLPCAWIYNRVGLHILNMANLENNPYKEWIIEYGNEEFTAGVNALLELIDAWADRADDNIKAQMTEAYLMAAIYEYAFWDYGYRGENANYDYLNDFQKKI